MGEDDARWIVGRDDLHDLQDISDHGLEVASHLEGKIDKNNRKDKDTKDKYSKNKANLDNSNCEMVENTVTITPSTANK